MFLQDERKEQHMEFCKTVRLPVGFAEAVPKVKKAFAGQGFGTLTEIDVKATLETTSSGPTWSPT